MLVFTHLKVIQNDIKLVFEINTRLQTNISIKKSILKMAFKNLSKFHCPLFSLNDLVVKIVLISIVT